jgi:hypothetical protein
MGAHQSTSRSHSTSSSLVAVPSSATKKRKISLRKLPSLRRKKSKKKTFHQFHLLSDEIILEILSYVTDAPFENNTTIINANDKISKKSNKVKRSNNSTNINDNFNNNNSDSCTHRSSLTHTLPLVSKQFRELCHAESLWITSLQRLIYQDPVRWKYALSLILNCDANADTGRTGTNTDLIQKKPSWSAFYNPQADKNDFLLHHKVQQMDTFTQKEIMGLVLDIYNSVQEDININMTTISTTRTTSTSSTGSTGTDSNDIIMSSTRTAPSDVPTIYGAREFYLAFVMNYIQATMPIFQMRYGLSIRIGMSIALNLFESRYKHLISEIMLRRQSKPKDYRGRTLKHPRPKFIFAPNSISKGSIAYIAEVYQCKMLQPGGRAKIKINIVKKVSLFNSKERPGWSGLHDGEIKRFH